MAKVPDRGGEPKVAQPDFIGQIHAVIGPARFAHPTGRSARFVPCQWSCAVALAGALTVFDSTACAQSIRPGMGATPYADAFGTGVTFRVWSPRATSVAVRGTFNGWSITPMAEESASDLWSVDVGGVTNGSQYKYFINGTYWWK